MKLEFNREQLLALMKDFYILTGIRIVLFDDEYRELLAYPNRDCEFCRMMKASPATRLLCAGSDEASFKKCEARRQLTVYHCHAGLIEAAVPLVDRHIVIGYLMFGQISDAPNRTALRAQLQHVLAEHQTVVPASADYTHDIALRTEEQIQAAAKIMEACTQYALLNESIALRRQNFSDNLRAFLLEHLEERLDADSIARQLGISRGKLYQACEKYLGMGIAEYLRLLRLDEAMRLLRETDLTVTEISAKIGFGDYNYFCRFFKKETGYPARKYREQFRNSPGSVPSQTAGDSIIYSRS